MKENEHPMQAWERRRPQEAAEATSEWSPARRQLAATAVSNERRRRARVEWLYAAGAAAGALGPLGGQGANAESSTFDVDAVVNEEAGKGDFARWCREQAAAGTADPLADRVFPGKAAVVLHAMRGRFAHFAPSLAEDGGTKPAALAVALAAALLDVFSTTTPGAAASAAQGAAIRLRADAAAWQAADAGGDAAAAAPLLDGLAATLARLAGPLRRLVGAAPWILAEMERHIEGTTAEAEFLVAALACARPTSPSAAGDLGGRGGEESGPRADRPVVD